MANHKILRYGTAGQWMVVLDGDRGLPEGGFNRQTLVKVSGANFDSQWRDPAGFTFTQAGAPTAALDGTSALINGETWYDTANGDSKVWITNQWVKFSGGDDDARFVNTSGDTLTGQLNGVTPTAAPNLTRKDYVDTQVATATTAASNANTAATNANNNANNRVAKSGDTMTGTLNMVSGSQVKFSNELGTRLVLYDGYSLGIEGGTLRYIASAGGGTHAFSGAMITTDNITAGGYVTAGSHIGIAGADLKPWTYGANWGALQGGNGYLLINNNQDHGSGVYLRSNAVLNLGGPSGIAFENTVITGITTNGGVSAVSQVRSQGPAGDAYNASNLFADSPGVGVASNGYHPSGVACQFRMGQNVQVLYLMGIYGGDNNVTAQCASWQSTSSRDTKQDIHDWPLTKSRSLSAAATEFGPLDPIDAIKSLRPVWFRREENQWFKRLPSTVRRTEALHRLNAVREKQGLKRFDSPELRHTCGRDCAYSPDNPCEQIRDWETGVVGFISEEVGEVLPQLTKLDPHTGTHNSLDGLAVAALAIAASKVQQDTIDDLLARIEALESQVVAQG